MENYRKKLKTQNIIMAVCIAVLAMISLLGFAAEAGLLKLTPSAGDSHWQSQWRGFMSGASMGILGLMLFGLIRNLLAMKDEKKLKKLYNEVHDERTEVIYTHARSSAMSVFLIAGLIAAIIAGYFSISISLSILVCVVAASLLSVGFKIYYNKKF